MRAVIQRVTEASVAIDERVTAQIEHGLLVLLAVEETDSEEDAAWLGAKIARLRVFNDSQGLMNLSVIDVGGNALVVSQFTLFASTKKGNRPSYSRSAKPETAIPLYRRFLEHMAQALGHTAPAGEFGADMRVRLVNDGPVTIIIDSKNRE